MVDQPDAHKRIFDGLVQDARPPIVGIDKVTKFVLDNAVTQVSTKAVPLIDPDSIVMTFSMQAAATQHLQQMMAELMQEPVNDLGECAYYRGAGICSYGCFEEPRCQTEEPERGWPSVIRDMIFGTQMELDLGYPPD